MSRLVELDHPLAAHHLTVLRDVAPPPWLFRQQVQRWRRCWRLPLPRICRW